MRFPEKCHNGMIRGVVAARANLSLFVIEAVVGLETGGRRSRRSGFIDPPE
jgi:hypothetical protein